MNNFTQALLPNGIRLIIAPVEGVQTATVLAMFGTGSRYETPQTNGMAHFLEHMFFKGTAKRPTSLDITKELDGVGASFNAFTSKDHTGYYVKVAAQHLPKAIDVVSDMLLNSKLDAVELEKEKGVIVEEINMYRDNPLMYIHDIYEEEMYKGSSLGWLIAGSHETVRATTRESMVAYKNTHYKGENTVIAVAGKIPENIKELIEQAFGELPGKPSKYSEESLQFEKFVVSQTKPRVKLLERPTEQAQFALGFPAYSSFHPDKTILSMLSIVLGGNMSSRLFMTVREKLGLAYMIRSGVNKYQDTGNLMIQAGLDRSKIPAAVKVIREELEKMISTPVDAGELQRAKDYVAGKIAISLEDSSSVASWYADQQLMNFKSETPAQRIAKINTVTAEEMQRVAKDVIKPELATLAIIGPYKNSDEFLPLLG